MRSVTAYALWLLGCLLSVVLAGGALLVALKADPASVWGCWLEAADLLTVGWFDRGSGPAPGQADVRGTVLRWGSAALAVLVAGAALQWLVRPRA